MKNEKARYFSFFLRDEEKFPPCAAGMTLLGAGEMKKVKVIRHQNSRIFHGDFKRRIPFAPSVIEAHRQPKASELQA